MSSDHQTLSSTSIDRHPHPHHRQPHPHPHHHHQNSPSKSSPTPSSHLNQNYKTTSSQSTAVSSLIRKEEEQPHGLASLINEQQNRINQNTSIDESSSSSSPEEPIKSHVHSNAKEVSEALSDSRSSSLVVLDDHQLETTTTTTTTTDDDDNQKKRLATIGSGLQDSHPCRSNSSPSEIDPINALEDQSNDDHGPLVDMETFGQLLEMDDDDEHSFSKSLTWDYFDQAVTTFQEMDTAVLGGDLITLSRKGHFLKGSSAALGLNRVKASCEKMQHFGNKKKANGEGTLSETEAMDECKSLLKQLKEEQKLSKAWLERFYAERNL